MENTLAGLLTRALHSVNPVMGDGSRAATDQYCELCRSTGLHGGGDAIRCDCWCHPARAALRAAGAGWTEAAPGGASAGAHRRKPAR
ncbi:MAG TPA: hypothetical protein VKB84_18325, partial [Candidatus Binataceae bacterium]|nr:hypothetical protein [Candidatus Binataceae bacterium]